MERCDGRRRSPARQIRRIQRRPRNRHARKLPRTHSRESRKPPRKEKGDKQIVAPANRRAGVPPAVARGARPRPPILILRVWGVFKPVSLDFSFPFLIPHLP